ncbi:hypothetical protein VTJ83DRAFT_4017 [Remersonia thermophila]|uniref:Autophagy-related protein 2 n=1 Tax=Remersonia thermophila TaxID=72144 RepID=A0ABR4DFR3_9PEZI
MASFFQSFRSSSMSKQLLRFALSKLDLLDSEALDLDNLDFALGRNTVLEFRDVGLVLPKLEKLLGLPPDLALRRAKVLLLRVTIPMDFYTSPITAEVDGVDIRLKVSSQKRRGDKDGGEQEADTEDEVVPSARDLAKSFLETQPVADKMELEEALAAENQDLAASVATSSSWSDDESTIGTGQVLTLPTFLTNFLQGIVDRLQVRVRGVTAQVDVEVPVDPSSTTPECVTVELSLEKLNVEGVTSAGPSDDDGPSIVPKEGKRHVILENIRAALISETTLFASLARSPSMPSSIASRSPVGTDEPASQPRSLAASLSSGYAPSVEAWPQSRHQMGDSEAAFNIPYELDNTGEAGRAVEPTSSLSTPRASIYLDSPPPGPRDPARSEVVGPAHPTWESLARAARSEPFLRPTADLPPPRTPSPAGSAHSEPQSTCSGDTGVDELAQSRVFSHEEAESMYMSAFSQAESVRLRSGMPGAWDSSEDVQKKDETPAAPAAPEAPTTSTTSTSAAPQSEDHDESEPAQEEAVPEIIPKAFSQAFDCETDEPEEEPVPEEPLPEEPVSDEQSPEDTATPRGATRLVKEILTLSSISVYLPSSHTDVAAAAAPAAAAAAAAADLGKSTPDLPGAFSVHASGQSSRLIPSKDQPTTRTPVDSSIEIDLKPIEIRFDASIGFLLAMVVSRLLEAIQSTAAESVAPANEKPSAGMPDIKVAVEQLSVVFLEKLAGVADVPKRMFERSTSDFGSDVLLQLQLTDLRGSLSGGRAGREAAFSIEKMTFGYANDDIISFDRSVLMFESVATTFPSAGQDVSIKATLTPEESRIEINTLPLHVKLDLQRLDETFGWFGGLSSFLHMGASITSSQAVSQKGPAKQSPKPSKGVRFDEPAPPDDPSGPETKIDLRVNGVRVDVVGRECSVAVNTSALKLVCREEGVGIHFSRIRLSGPHLKRSGASAPVMAEVLDTRIEYRSVPRTKDLERLLELITPSKIRFDENEDEIMVDTLLRQRRKGPVLCVTVSTVRVDASELQQLGCLPGLAEDLAKLGTVAKYLPEDDRPGLLTLCRLKNIDTRVDVGGRFGAVQAALAELEVAHISVPELVAVALGEVSVSRNTTEKLITTLPAPKAGSSSAEKPPALMMRLIDDIQPVVKLKVMGLNVEYRVPTVMDLLGLAEGTAPEDYEASLAASVANLGDQAHAAIKRQPSDVVSSAERTKPPTKPLKLDIGFQDCLVGLNPLGLTSKMLIVLTDAHLDMPPVGDAMTAVASLRRAAILLIDDVSILDAPGAPFAATRRPRAAPSPQVTELCAKGYVNICQISSAKATVAASKDADGEMQLEVELRDDLLVLETCADSTQTLIGIANALTPPTPPSKEIKFRTSVVPIQDLLASISAETFGQAEGEYDFDKDFALARELDGADADSEADFGRAADSPLPLEPQFYEDAVQEELFDATSSSVLAGSTRIEDTRDGVLLSTASLGRQSSRGNESSSDDLSVKEDYFAGASSARGTAHRWDSRANKYEQHTDLRSERAPLKVSVRDVHVIWHLFDGYDWARTREVIAKAVQEVEAKAYERRADRGHDADLDEDEVIGDCLFNSIYIGIPANRDPRELTQAINHGLQDFGDTESIATSAVTTTTYRAAGQHRRPKGLKLSRSRRHKITFELKGVNVDFVMFPPGSGETLNSIDVRVRDLDIFDHVPTSTWKKFAMYDIDAGERELGADMVHLEVITTRLVDTPATELVIGAKVLPLRLHVDQDALDFITRFFGFKDDAAPVHASPADVPFIQRIAVDNIPVRLDFKPKRVDYAGLRSGKTTEFMNFMILEDARMVLRRVILYGVSGFDRLGEQLNDIWMADVKKNQLPGVLAGLASVRSIVTAGSGFRELVEIPIREYRKDGRLVRSLKKGARAFARTTGTEVVKLGAKLAIGTQAGNPGGAGHGSPAALAEILGDEWDEEEYEEDARRQVSLYADQPLGILQGVRSAYGSLARDLAVARDAIIAVPAEIMESGSAQGAATAVLKKAPTIILRPAIGATKAIGQTLLGATNSLDPMQRRRVENKYKSH